MIEVVPAILPVKYEDIELRAGKVAGGAKSVQVDIADGLLVPAKTWPYTNRDFEEDLAKLISREKGLPEWGEMEYELDMMIERPSETFEQWLDAGFSTLIPHREAADDDELYYMMRTCRARGAGFGIALLPSTTIVSLERWFKDVDFFQVMGSNTIGRQGIPLSEAAIARVADIHAVAPSVTIAVDIGVNLETAPRLVAAGATKLVAGSAIWKSKDPIAAIHALEALGG